MIYKISLLFFLLIMKIGFSQDINQFNEKGNRQGLWRGYYENTKNLKYEGIFEDGKEVGTFTFYDNLKEKTIVATRTFNDLGHAYTTFFKGKFKVSEGLVVDKKYEGLWITYHKESNIIMMKENYKNGELHGEKKVYYHDGDIVEESVYNNGKRHGLYKKYALSGKVIEELNYKNGKIHGKAIYRDYKGEVIIEGQYKNDLSSGIWTYYKNGKIERTEDKDAQKKARNPGENAPASAVQQPIKKKPNQR